jgi:hypothetical protein
MARRRGRSLIPKRWFRMGGKGGRNGIKGWIPWVVLGVGAYAAYEIFIKKSTGFFPDIDIYANENWGITYPPGGAAPVVHPAAAKQAMFGGLSVNPVIGWGYGAGYEEAGSVGQDVTALDRILVG